MSSARISVKIRALVVTVAATAALVGGAVAATDHSDTSGRGLRVASTGHGLN